jgi:hypothetical protein
LNILQYKLLKGLALYSPFKGHPIWEPGGPTITISKLALTRRWT